MPKTKIILFLIILLLTVSFPAYAGVFTGLEWQYQEANDTDSINAAKIGLDMTSHWMVQTSYNLENEDLSADLLYKTKAGTGIESYVGLGVRDLLQKSDSQLSTGDKMELAAGMIIHLSSNPRTGLFLAMEFRAVPSALGNESSPDILKPTASISLNYYIPNFPKSGPRIEGPASISKSDFELLARVVSAEAGDEPFEGQIAVAAVVLNRVRSSEFPNTIREVIYQNGQFKCLPKLSRITPTESAYKAVEAAANDQDPSRGALYYYNPKLSSPEGLAFFRSSNLKITVRIGNHIFLKEPESD